MSDIFTERSRAFEEIFARQLEADYKIRAHADWSFGLWAAAQLKITDSERAKKYALEIIQSEAINAKRHIELVLISFESAGIDMSRGAIVQKYQEFYKNAKDAYDQGI